MVKDPVCGMEVEEDTDCVEYKGKRYCFCDEACREAFLKDPPRYIEGCC